MITAGTILMEKGTVFPPCFQVEDGSYPSAWMSVQHKLSFQKLGKELAATGWAFFHLAGEIRTSAFGFDRAKSVQAALKRLIEKVKLQNCNCLEIDEVVTRSFLGLPYVSIAAHARHIQTGMVLAGH